MAVKDSLVIRIPRPCADMATALKPGAGKPGVEEGEPVHRIRITLTSKNVKNLEKGEPHI